jgi:hypothetical protein
MFCICNKNCIAVCFIWVQLEFVGIPNLSFIIAKGKILHKSDLMNCLHIICLLILSNVM